MLSRPYLKKTIKKCIFGSILGIGLVCFMIQTSRATAHGELAMWLWAWILSGHPLFFNPNRVKLLFIAGGSIRKFLFV